MEVKCRSACSHILITLLVAVVDAENLPVSILWQAEDAGAFLTFTLLALLRYGSEYPGFLTGSEFRPDYAALVCVGFAHALLDAYFIQFRPVLVCSVLQPRAPSLRL